MRGYTLYQDRVVIHNDNGTSGTIYFNQDSGKVYYRYKIGSMTHIKHPGIYLGHDVWGNHYFLHNHYLIGKADIVTAQGFSQGMPLYLYNEYCTNDWLTVIRKGLDQIIQREPYKPFSYNCQTYTNSACHNQRKSDDADKLIGGGLVVGGLALLAAAILS